MKFPDYSLLGSLSIEDVGEFDIVMVRRGLDEPEAPAEMDTVQGREAWEAGYAAAQGVRVGDDGLGAAGWDAMYADHVRLRDAVHAVAVVVSEGDAEVHPHDAHFDCDWFADQLAADLAAQPAPPALDAMVRPVSPDAADRAEP